MDARKESKEAIAKNETTVERLERELVITRLFNGPVRIVFDAWTRPELLKRWWAPKSFGVALVSCEVDARTGGSYRLGFSHPSSESVMEFFGRYIEVVPYRKLVWTNEEAEPGPVTTVTFEERGSQTLVVMRDVYPSKEALDAAIESGSTHGFGETFVQLDELLVALGASVGS
jgi:uncharacterized protein YndB with AHSA1/START domain